MRHAVLAVVLAAQGAPEPREIRQLTSGGTHAEAYWAPDGKRIVLMGERPGDPADQIYELEVATGALTRVSTGKGKAT
jgi:dipeptidyl aminopeptidase/acylaminoacyl peptidase